MEVTPEKPVRRGRWKAILLLLLAVGCGSVAAWWFGPWSAAYRYPRMSLVSLRRMLDDHPNDALGWRILGLRLAHDGDAAMAEPALIQAYALNQKDAEVATGLAEILIAENHYSEAFELLKRAVGNNPRSVVAQMALGRLYREKGSYLHASEAFNAVVQADPKAAGAWYELATCYLETQRTAQAQEAIAQALRLLPADPNCLALKGTIEIGVGNIEAGLAALQQAAQLAPASLKVQSDYLNALLTGHRNNEDLDRAEQVIAIIEQINPDNPLLPFEHGELERLRGHWAVAARFLERSTQTAPEHTQTYYSLGLVCRRLNRTADAERALAIFRRRQDLQRQMDDVRATLGSQPNNADLYSRLADLQARQGDLTGAVDSLRNALNINPNQAALKTRLAQLQSRLGSAPKATP